MRYFLLGVILLTASGRISTADNGGSAFFSCLDHVVHEILRSLFELRHLEHSHRPIPDDSFCLRDGLRVQLAGLSATIQAHKAVRNAFLLRCILDLTILPKL